MPRCGASSNSGGGRVVSPMPKMVRVEPVTREPTLFKTVVPLYPLTIQAADCVSATGLGGPVLLATYSGSVLHPCHSRVTNSRNPGDTGVTSGHEDESVEAREEPRGHHRPREDTALPRFGTVRPGVQIPGPRPDLVLKIDHSEAYRPHRSEIARPLFHGVQELPADLLAATAGLSADPAVLVHLGMPLALVTAALACGRARFKQRLRDL